jgi:mRNA-degrading endonuclease toxin of MazEF toxin-antitoxin module
MKTTGAVQVDQIRSIDRTERMFRTIESAPKQLVRNVRMTFAALVEMEAGPPLGEPDRNQPDL